MVFFTLLTSNKKPCFEIQTIFGFLKLLVTLTSYYTLFGSLGVTCYFFFFFSLALKAEKMGKKSFFSLIPIQIPILSFQHCTIPFWPWFLQAFFLPSILKAFAKLNENGTGESQHVTPWLKHKVIFFLNDPGKKPPPGFEPLTLELLAECSIPTKPIDI